MLYVYNLFVIRSSVDQLLGYFPTLAIVIEVLSHLNTSSPWGSVMQRMGHLLWACQPGTEASH